MSLARRRNVIDIASRTVELSSVLTVASPTRPVVEVSIEMTLANAATHDRVRVKLFGEVRKDAWGPPSRNPTGPVWEKARSLWTSRLYLDYKYFSCEYGNII